MAVGRHVGRWMFLGGVLIFLLAFLVGGEHGLMRYAGMKRYERELSSRIASLREGNAVLTAEVRRLTSDPVVLEGLARSQLQMVRPGEVVFLLPGEPAEGAR